MQHQLLKYQGKYRILPELDVFTHDIPKDKHGSIAKGYDDIYIACQYGNKIFAYGKDSHKNEILIAYIPSIGRGHNIIKFMNEQNIQYFNYIQTDAEIEFHFYAKDIDIIANLLKAKTFGSSISPFSIKNLPKSKEIKIPDNELQYYKDIVLKVPRSESLVLHRITTDFLSSIVQNTLQKTDKNFNYKADMKRCLMTRQTKEYIYYKGFWNDYIKYLKERIN